MTRERAEALRALIERAAAGLPDADALTRVELFPVWRPDRDYTRNERVRWNGRLYRLIPETHHSQADCPPDLVPAIWARVADPAEEWPQWWQPLGWEEAA